MIGRRALCAASLLMVMSGLACSGDDDDDASGGGASAGVKGIAWSDFEVVDGGQPIDWDSGSCERTAISE